jgi:glycosyltransferase involved in cell wall biosynthesis
VVVVMPVYNEEGVIRQVVEEWLQMLDSLGAPYRLQIWNDGSTDGTETALKTLKHPCLEVKTAKNRGHGPTILRAYKAAAERAPWVFQTDSDGELPAEVFPSFWAEREQMDLVIGIRTGRNGPLIRRLISVGSRTVIRLLFGRGPRDVNCPYRLIRSSAFFSLLDRLPEDTFAPNLLIAGHAGREQLRTKEIPVPFTPRTAGVPSIRRWKLLRAAFRCTRQTLAFRFRPADP